MVPYTRRTLLHVAAAAVGSLAGCSRILSGSGQSATSASQNNGTAVPNGGAETDPAMFVHRSDSETVPIRFGDPDQEARDPGRLDYPLRHISTTVIDSQSRSQRLTVADSVDGTAFSSFVSETDFDSETLYLESNPVRECFELQLCRITWQPTEIRTDYVQKSRPYNEHCVANDRVVESRLFRIPAALSEESVNSYGSSVSGSYQCRMAGPAQAEGEGGSGGPEATMSQRKRGEQ